MRAYITMLPRLAAGESMDDALAVALGTGSMKKGEARKAMAALKRRASIARPRAVKPSPATLAAMGIAVVRQDG